MVSDVKDRLRLPTAFLIPIAVLLFVVSKHNYLLFHSLTEGFSIIVAALIYVLATKTYSYSQDAYFLFIGVAYFFIAWVDFFHTATYYGMNIIVAESPNIATQLWIAGRYLEAVSLLMAPIFVIKEMKARRVFFGYLVVAGVLLYTILGSGLFPDCYVDGGLTLFKVASEYIVCFLILGGIWQLMQRKERMEKSVYSVMTLSMVVTIASELSFTLYSDPYGIMNFVGHMLKVVSFALIYRGLVIAGLKSPYKGVLHKLQGALAELKKRSDYLEKQLVVARQVQANNLPTGNEICGVEMAMIYQPLWQVGGDFCHVIPIEQNKNKASRYGLIVGDVVGKGPAAALISSELVAASREAGGNGESPSYVLTALNERMCKRNIEEMRYLATACYMIIDIERGEITISNAGHEPPVLLNFQSGKASLLNTEGLIVGVTNDVVFFEDKKINVSSGDKLVLYTDGLSQLQNPSGVLFGNERLLEIVESYGHESAEKLAQRIEESMRSFGEGIELDDDLLLIVLHFRDIENGRKRGRDER